MKNRIRGLIKKVIAIVITFILLMIESAFVVVAKEPDEATPLSDTETADYAVPAKEVCLELRAVEVKEVSGQNKQVVMELWGNDINFQGFDVRFSYDSTKLKPSSLETNEVITTPTDQTTDAVMSYFKFEPEFENKLELIRIPYKETKAVDGNEVETLREDVIRAVTAFNPPTSPTEHMVGTPPVMTVITPRRSKTWKDEFPNDSRCI